ncbi:hypothetical protein [uncultured Methanobrevibacter sp.]|uniref:hypothetical protein n=1 Tax=uncultured Methanobrevibacter sp. TaxID=253161 RepID=UPI0026328AB3|nr:hypothetical protein [uncultured Methanobrevibacter sp.]
MGKIETPNQRYWARLNGEIKNCSNYNPKQNEYGWDEALVWQVAMASGFMTFSCQR